MKPGADFIPGMTLEMFSKALSEGEIVVGLCPICRTQQAIPAESCFNCGHAGVRVQRHRGDGVLFSWVVCHYSFEAAWKSEVPYIVALVDIDGGGRIYGRISGGLEHAPGLRAGLPVELDAAATSAKRYPVYLPKGPLGQGGK